MAFFKRNKGKNAEQGTGSSSSRSSEASNRPSREEAGAVPPNSRATADEPASEPALPESSPQRVGVVSGILTTSATLGGSSHVGEIVDRHFGPAGKGGGPTKDAKKAERRDRERAPLPPQHETLRVVESRPNEDEEMELPRLEVDPMAHIGHETTITGSIVAKEDLEIEGTIEGSIRLADHQLTVGCDGLVKANVEAHTVLVLGRISGDVVASELVEIKAGGVIGGDVKSPRVIMHDGGVVVGGLDMSAALPSSGQAALVDEVMPSRPKLIRVEPSADLSEDGERG